MTKIFIFDVECKGLIPKKGPGFNNLTHYTNLPKYDQCRLQSVCWKVYTDDGKALLTKYFVIKPKDFVIDNNSEATKIHGITSEIASNGVDIEDVFSNLEKDLEDVGLLVAHNIGFDIRIICSELHRYNHAELCNRFAAIATFCTCMNGENITKIRPSGWRNYKIPKLTELYKHLFHEDFTNQHNAEADVQACARCYFKMITLQ